MNYNVASAVSIVQLRTRKISDISLSKLRNRASKASEDLSLSFHLKGKNVRKVNCVCKGLLQCFKISNHQL